MSNSEVVLKEGELWIKVGNIDVLVRREKTGIVIAAYPEGLRNILPLTRTHAWFQEAADVQDQEQPI